MKEFAERVYVIALLGSALMRSPSLLFSLRNSSVIMRWGIDMPSPMKRKTYFTGFGVRCCAATAESAVKTAAQSAENVLMNLPMIY